METGWTCIIEAPETILSTCYAICGDGYILGAETCDDKNEDDDDGCSYTDDCIVEAGWICTGTDNSVCATVCGDGLIRGDEECDDGIVPATPAAALTDLTGVEPVDGDGCSTICAVEPYWECPTDLADPASAGPGLCSPICGDGFLVLASIETCDDGA